MDAKTMAQQVDQVTPTRAGAIKRRLAQQTPPVDKKKKPADNDSQDIINSRKNMGY